MIKAAVTVSHDKLPENLKEKYGSWQEVCKHCTSDTGFICQQCYDYSCFEEGEKGAFRKKQKAFVLSEEQKKQKRVDSKKAFDAGFSVGKKKKEQQQKKNYIYFTFDKLNRIVEESVAKARLKTINECIEAIDHCVTQSECVESLKELRRNIDGKCSTEN